MIGIYYILYYILMYNIVKIGMFDVQHGLLFTKFIKIHYKEKMKNIAC